MPLFILQNHHEPAECDATFAAWQGFESPLRRHPAASTCLAGEHRLWWRVEAGSAEEALALLPEFVASRTRVTGIREVEIP
jgi:hypothetical protein